MNHSRHNKTPGSDEPVQGFEQSLVARVREMIAQAGGAVDFSEFMQCALYEPGLGYYMAGLRKFGPEGDFVTAPEMGDLFGRCLARQCAEVLDTLSGGDMLEFGAGSGLLCAQLLAALDERGVLPDRYCILELSPDLRERQRNTIREHCPGLLECCQ